MLQSGTKKNREPAGASPCWAPCARGPSSESGHGTAPEVGSRGWWTPECGDGGQNGRGRKGDTDSEGNYTI